MRRRTEICAAAFVLSVFSFARICSARILQNFPFFRWEFPSAVRLACFRTERVLQNIPFSAGVARRGVTRIFGARILRKTFQSFVLPAR